MVLTKDYRICMPVTTEEVKDRYIHIQVLILFNLSTKLGSFI